MAEASINIENLIEKLKKFKLKLNQINNCVNKFKESFDEISEVEVVTIIIPIKNRLDYRLVNALKSIRNQDYDLENVEVILVDYGSMKKDIDGLNELCSKFNVRYIRVNGVSIWNRSHALNIGIKNASGKYILCTDVDVIFESNYLTEAIFLLKKNSNQVLWSDVLDLGFGAVEKEIDVANDYQNLKKKSKLRSKIMNSNYPYGLGIIIALKKYFFDIRGYDEYYKYWGQEDDDLIKRFKIKGLTITNIFDKTSYLHQWHTKYEGLNESGKMQIDRNKKYLKKMNSVKRNLNGWGINPFNKLDYEIINLNEKFTSDLAVVSCYFNPCNYSVRKKNYRIFRKGIVKTGVRFLTVELAFGDDEFELSEFPEVMQLRTSKDNIMWQKERLLNIGIKKLIAEGYEKIAWLDADIVFEDDDWVKKVSKELDKHNVVQVFGEVKVIEEKINNRDSKGSIKNYLCSKRDFYFGIQPGFGWAAKSEILKKVELYDTAITGSGDFLFLLACFYLDNFKLKIEKHSLMSQINKGLEHDFYNWAKKISKIVRGDVSFVDSTINALYHGKLVNRKYVDRHIILKKYNYDPEKDVRLGRNGLLEWSSDKPEFHKEIKDYFYSRKEDN